MAWLRVGIVLLLSLWGLYAPARADVYACKDAQGRTHLRDTPCPAGSTEQFSAAARPPSAPRPLAPAPAAPVLPMTPTPAKRPDTCITLADVDAKPIQTNYSTIESSWRVRVHNACLEAVPVLVTFKWLDRAGYEIDAAQQEGVVLAQQDLTLSGTRLISKPKLQQLYRHEAQVRVR